MMKKLPVEKLIWQYLPDHRVAAEESRLKRIRKKIDEVRLTKYPNELPLFDEKSRRLLEKKTTDASFVGGLVDNIRDEWKSGPKTFLGFRELALRIHKLLNIIPFEERKFFPFRDELAVWLHDNSDDYFAPDSQEEVFSHLQSMWERFMQGALVRVPTEYTFHRDWPTKEVMDRDSRAWGAGQLGQDITEAIMSTMRECE
jgi:hypothetical protein